MGLHPFSIKGFTLIELLVTLTILSILATVALPFVEVTVVRTKELELHSSLREVRIAIDNFHEDWVNGKISKTNTNVSEDGYPVTLQILVDGVERSIAKGGKSRYLRRIPRDPFTEKDNIEPKESWAVRGYQDEITSTVWGGHDVYDIHSMSDKVALDGSHYKDW
jgi:general secretion pathway protein G